MWCSFVEGGKMSTFGRVFYLFIYLLNLNVLFIWERMWVRERQHKQGWGGEAKEAGADTPLSREPGHNQAPSQNLRSWPEGKADA